MPYIYEGESHGGLLVGPKSPGDSVLDWPVDWNDLTDPDEPPWLQDGEVIVSVTTEVSPDGELSVVQANIEGGTVVRLWLTGGVHGTNYRITLRITTNTTPARVDRRTIVIPVRQR